MEALNQRAWSRTMLKHNQFAALMFLFTLLSSLHIVIGSSQAINLPRKGANNTFVEDTMQFRLMVTAGYSLQAFFTIIYPLTNYAYISLCVVLTVQSEHLNQVCFL